MKATAIRVAVLACAAVATAAGYEGPRTFQASEVLTPAQIKGPHFVVQPEVPTEGYFHVFQLKTDFGAIEAEGRGMLPDARARDEGNRPAQRGLQERRVPEGRRHLGRERGQGRRRRGLGPRGHGQGRRQRSQEASAPTSAERRREPPTRRPSPSKGDDKPQEGASKSTTEKAAEAGTGIAYSALGVNRGARTWAQKVGVDPYTTNPVLKKALADIGKVDAAGGLAAKIVVPIPMVVSGTATVGNLVWGKDPEELMKVNEAKLKQLGVGDDVIKQLYLSKGFTLSLQTRSPSRWPPSTSRAAPTTWRRRPRRTPSARRRSSWRAPRCSSGPTPRPA